MQYKEVPNSIEVEQSLLGIFLTYTKSIQLALEKGLQEESFYDIKNKTIFKVMKELRDNKSLTDITTVMEALKERKLFDRAGGMTYLTDLTVAGGSKSNINDFVDVLEDKRLLRQLLEIGNKLNHDILNSGVTSSEIMSNAEREILEVTRSKRVSEFASVIDVIPELLEEIKFKSEQEGGITGLETGFKDLDWLTGGLQKNDLIILASRPSVGKSAFALNLAKNVAMINEKPVAIFSLEMPKTQLVQRMISAHGEIEGNKLRDGRLKDDDWNELFETAHEVKDMPIFIDDSATMTMSEVFSKCRKLKNEHDLSMVIIDYLQLMTSVQKGRSREQEVAEIARNLKELAMELEIPVMALSQLSRRVEQREDKRPILSDLRESGSIEQDGIVLQNTGIYL